MLAVWVWSNFKILDKHLWTLAETKNLSKSTQTTPEMWNAFKVSPIYITKHILSIVISWLSRAIFCTTWQIIPHHLTLACIICKKTQKLLAHKLWELKNRSKWQWISAMSKPVEQKKFTQIRDTVFAARFLSVVQHFFSVQFISFTLIIAMSSLFSLLIWHQKRAATTWRKKALSFMLATKKKNKNFDFHPR